MDYFSSINLGMRSEYFNPADHLLDLVSVDPRSSNQKSSLERVQRITSAWHSVAARGETGAELNRSAGGKMSRGEGTTSMRVALPVVIERHWKNLWRRKDVGVALSLHPSRPNWCDQIFFNRLVQTPLLGGLFILFFQRLTHGPSGGLIFLSVRRID